MRPTRALLRAATATAALFVPLLTTVPAHADALPTLSVADVTAAEPPYGTTAPLVFTPTLDAPAAAATRVYVELWSELPGNPGLYERTGQSRDLEIPAGATSVSASFTLRGDAYDQVRDYRYQARVSARIDQVANPSVVATALVADTTRNGEFRCLTIPTPYDSMGVGTPIGPQSIDTTTGDPFTAWCNNGERHRAQYASADGSVVLRDIVEQQEVDPAYGLLYRTAPAVGDHARVRAEVGTASLRIGDVTIEATGLTSEIRASCTAVGPEAVFSGTSNVARLQVTSTVLVGGVPVARTRVYAPGEAPLELRVGTLTIGVNQVTDVRRTVAWGAQTGEPERIVNRRPVVAKDDVRGDLASLGGTYLTSADGNVCDF